MTKAQIVALLEGKCLVDTNEKLIHTCEGTFSVVKKKSFGPPNNPANDNRPNRAQTLWKMSRHVIIEDIVTDDLVWEGQAATKSEKDQVLETWRLVTSKDPDRPNKKQSLYFTQDGAEYCRYDADANLTRSGTLDQLIDDCGYITSTSIEAKFRLWLPKNGVAQDKADGYVRHLKAISESPAPHTATGAWDGFYYDLIGNHPSRKVFEISSLCEFDVVYSELRRFFDQSAPDSAGYNAANYQQCYDYSHDSRGGDQRTMLNGFKKYREFLGGLARFDVLAAIRTKPFILLAGISGTGKSRLVRQLARGCCPEWADAARTVKHPFVDEQKPGNFEIVPVRPNWHDSTELMGYVTRITEDGKPEYVLTPFVKFLAKSWMNPGIPFFLCLDEMNLAPVEQYFAEYLSAIESRKWVDASDHTKGMTTDVVVRFGAEKSNGTVDPFVEATVKRLLPGYGTDEVGASVKALGDAICEGGGISIPPNLVVMGTVNMDETTCSFSRKVLDRAMTFELNDVSNMYTIEEINGEGNVPFGSIAADQVKCSFLGAKEAVNSDAGKVEVAPAKHETVAKRILDYIKTINDKLENTPFKIGYRSRDEIMIYCLERTKGGMIGLAQALDEATSMKILSRIEGDDQKLEYPGEEPQHKDKNLLGVLEDVIAEALKVANGGEAPTGCMMCADKLKFMQKRLRGGFTNFFV